MKDVVRLIDERVQSDKDWIELFYQIIKGGTDENELRGFICAAVNKLDEEEEDE